MIFFKEAGVILLWLFLCLEREINNPQLLTGYFALAGAIFHFEIAHYIAALT